MATTFDIDQFREEFPEFANESSYSDSMITFWSGMGIALLNTDRWGTLLDYGLKLWTAHNISIAKQNDQAGVVPGTGAALLASESAGPLSYSRDTHSTVELDAGNYNLTTYGQQFIRLARIVGTGGYQIY